MTTAIVYSDEWRHFDYGREHPLRMERLGLTWRLMEAYGLTALPGVKVKAPRVAEAPINLECRIAQVIEVGRGPNNLVLGEIVHFHLRDDIYDPRTGRVDMHRLKPVGRLAGHQYAHVHDIFEMKRPSDSYRG